MAPLSTQSFDTPAARAVTRDVASAPMPITVTSMAMHSTIA
jgi:hypothetical protein